MLKAAREFDNLFVLNMPYEIFTITDIISQAHQAIELDILSVQDLIHSTQGALEEIKSGDKFRNWFMKIVSIFQKKIALNHLS